MLMYIQTHTCICALVCAHLNVHARKHIHTYTHSQTHGKGCRVTSMHFHPPLLLFDAPLERSSRSPSLTGQWLQSRCFDLGKHFCEVVSSVVEFYLSFRTCKLIYFEQQTLKERRNHCCLSGRTSCQRCLFLCFPQAERVTQLSFPSTGSVLEGVHTEHSTGLKPASEG